METENYVKILLFKTKFYMQHFLTYVLNVYFNNLIFFIHLYLLIVGKYVCLCENV